LYLLFYTRRSLRSPVAYVEFLRQIVAFLRANVSDFIKPENRQPYSQYLNPVEWTFRLTEFERRVYRQHAGREYFKEGVTFCGLVGSESIE